MAFELVFLHCLQDLRDDFLNNIMIFFTRLGDGAKAWIAIAILLFLFSFRRNLTSEKRVKMQGTAILVLIALAVTSIIVNLVIKNMVTRDRPFIVDETLINLVIQSGYSFPSGHSASAFTAATTIFRYNKKIGSGAIVLAMLVAVSRLYVSVHFPTDVIAGIVLGIVFAILVEKLLINRITILLNKVVEKRLEKTYRTVDNDK